MTLHINYNLPTFKYRVVYEVNPIDSHKSRIRLVTQTDSDYSIAIKL